MATSAIDESQRKAARVVGWAYLLAIPPAVFAEAAATASNLVAHERLFRLGTAANLAAFALDVVLITALYVVLKPVNRNLALLALAKIVTVAYYGGPIFIFELSMGFWLLFKGLRPAPSS